MLCWHFGALLLVTCLQPVYSQPACTDAQPSGGIRYSYHDTDCNQYVQCHQRPGSSEAVIVYRSCPWGYYWNQGTLQCDPSRLVSCPLAPCSGSRKIEGGGCRSFWTCRGNQMEATCCEPGYRYVDNSVGCTADYTCTDPCPGPCGVKDVCRSLPSWERVDFYNHNDENGGTYERICPTGTSFDILECGCVSNRKSQTCQPAYYLDFQAQSIANARSSWLTTNIRVINGEGVFTSSSSFEANCKVAQPSVSNPLIIMFRFKESFQQFGIRNLLLSNDCKQCNRLSVDLIGLSFVVSITRFTNRPMALLELSTQGFVNNNWKNAIVMYNGKELLAILRSAGTTYMKRTEAPKLKIMDCGMQFGAFSGTVDYLSVYSCNPGGRVVDLFPQNLNDVA